MQKIKSLFRKKPKIGAWQPLEEDAYLNLTFPDNIKDYKHINELCDKYQTPQLKITSSPPSYFVYSFKALLRMFVLLPSWSPELAEKIKEWSNGLRDISITIYVSEDMVNFLPQFKNELAPLKEQIHKWAIMRINFFQNSDTELGLSNFKLTRTHAIKNIFA